VRVKKEVRALCAKVCNSKIGSDEWKQATDELQKKWKFTPFNLLALIGPNPTIECNNENKFLVLEKEAER